MKTVIKYKEYEATISTLGAEVLELKKNGSNILWNRDGNYWGDSALVLFPFVGRNYDDTYTYRGKQYNIGIHGFGPKSEFSIVDVNDNSLTLSLSDNEETRKVYPFHFAFNITYSLSDDGLNIDFNVTNKSQDVMPFTMGYHPGFMLDKELCHYKVKFENVSEPKEVCIVTKCMLTGETEDLVLNNNELALSPSLFTESAKIYAGVGNVVSLLDENDTEIVKLQYDGFENIVLWQTLNSDAKFICIEGWRGLPGTFQHIDDIEKVENKTFLNPDTNIKYSARIIF